MRRFAITGSGPYGGDRKIVLTPEPGSTLAWADRPQHVTGTVTFNEKCLFSRFCELDNVSSDSDDAGIFPAWTIDHFISKFNAADGQTEGVGLFWHVRNADGKLIVVQDDVSGRLMRVACMALQKGMSRMTGIGGYDLADPADRVFAFDYEHSGRLDHLVLYRPGHGTIWILANHGGAFTPVYQTSAAQTGIGGYDLADPADRVFAFDYEHSGLLDHLILYRPGHGTIWILANAGKTWRPRYRSDTAGGGIGGYDLADPADRILAFDYDSKGLPDHLVLYRPGHGTIWILVNKGGAFTPVYQTRAAQTGIGGYGLADPADDIVTFDYEHDGRLDHLVPYRPGHGTIWVLEHHRGTFSAVFPIPWSELYRASDRLWILDVTRNADGRLEVFGMASDNSIWHTWQTAPGGAWNGGWAELYTATDRLRTLSAGRNGDGRLEVFGTNSDNGIWHTWQTAPGGAWNGGWARLYTAADQLMMLRAATNSDGRLEVVGIAPDERIWHTWQTTPGGAWNGGWAELYGPGDRLRTLEVGVNADGRLEVFGIASDASIWHTWQTTPGGAWNGSWAELYGPADRLRNLDVGRNGDGRLEVGSRASASPVAPGAGHLAARRRPPGLRDVRRGRAPAAPGQQAGPGHPAAG